MSALSPSSSLSYPAGWYAWLLPGELRNGRAIRVQRFGRYWAVWKDDSGEVRVIADRCPHRGASLAQGQLKDGCLACPFHGFRYNGEGRCVAIPAHGKDGKIPRTMRVQSLPARQAHGYIWVFLGASEPQAPPEFFSEVQEGFSFRTLTSDWDASLSRCVENQLDYAHLPFVHKTTIGRSFPHEIDVTTTVKQNRVRGSVSLPTLEHFVELIFPNVWLNPVGGGGYVQIAFVPLTELRTRLYVRTYQRRVRLPLLRTLANVLLAWGNRIIINQDRAVVERQRPRISPPLDGSEVLVPSDGPIIAYRKLLAERPTLLP